MIMKSLAYTLTIIFTVFIIGSFITNPAYAWGYEQKDLEIYKRCDARDDGYDIIFIVWSIVWFVMMGIAIHVILKYRKDDTSKDCKDKDGVEDEDYSDEDDSGDKNTIEENGSEEENNNDLENKD